MPPFLVLRKALRAAMSLRLQPFSSYVSHAPLGASPTSKLLTFIAYQGILTFFARQGLPFGHEGLSFRHEGSTLPFEGQDEPKN